MVLALPPTFGKKAIGTDMNRDQLALLKQRAAEADAILQTIDDYSKAIETLNDDSIVRIIVDISRKAGDPTPAISIVKRGADATSLAPVPGAEVVLSGSDLAVQSQFFHKQCIAVINNGIQRAEKAMKMLRLNAPPAVAPTK